MRFSGRLFIVLGILSMVTGCNQDATNDMTDVIEITCHHASSPPTIAKVTDFQHVSNGYISGKDLVTKENVGYRGDCSYRYIKHEGS